MYRIPIDDLKTVTACKQKVKMISRLSQMGVRFLLDEHGWPVVHPDAYAQALGVKKKEGPRL